DAVRPRRSRARRAVVSRMVPSIAAMAVWRSGVVKAVTLRSGACDKMTVVPTRPFEPRFMKVGVLTAALQELTPRAVRDADPDRAIAGWIAFAAGPGGGELPL